MIIHKFLNTDFAYINTGFSTQNGILETPYPPRVLFIGTFNHGWEWNNADFFYGRAMYLWPVLYNIFTAGANEIKTPRNRETKIPTLGEIFSICNKAEIAFADLIRGTKNNVTTNIIVGEKKAIINNQICWDNYSDRQINYLGQQNLLDDNVTDIADYINNNSSIENIYFTFKLSNSWLSKLAYELKSKIYREVQVGSIMTPTGNGLGYLLPEYPSKAASIAHLWVWVNAPLSEVNPTPVNRAGYVHLDHQWLKDKNVSLENF